MKMHKKLFGLLATAAVGLTLTSCGGGGGGGGGSAPAPEETVNEQEKANALPKSLVGKQVTLVRDSWTYFLVFDTPSTLSGTVRDHEGKTYNVVNSTYAYVCDVSSIAKFPTLRFKLENTYTHKLLELEWNWDGMELYCDQTTGVITTNNGDGVEIH